MHARELVELAAIVSTHGPVLVRGSRRLSAGGIQQYWTASKCRLDRWARSLREFADAARASETAARVQWPFIRGVLEEIVTGEMLTRVWAAVVSAYDHERGADEGEPVARSVMMGHLEARNRVLMLLVRGPGVDAEAAVKLNHLRRRVERWTDLLVGYLTGLGDVSDLAFDPQRAKDFAQDLDYRSGRRRAAQAWPLVHASLRAAFSRGLSPVSPNADLNVRIASSILSCFPGDLFDSTGLFRSLWLVRMQATTSDVQGMIQDLLAPEPLAREPRTAAAKLHEPIAENRLRRFEH